MARFKNHRGANKGRNNKIAEKLPSAIRKREIKNGKGLSKGMRRLQGALHQPRRLKLHQKQHTTMIKRGDRPDNLPDPLVHLLKNTGRRIPFLAGLPIVLPSLRAFTQFKGITGGRIEAALPAAIFIAGLLVILKSILAACAGRHLKSHVPLSQTVSGALAINAEPQKGLGGSG